MFLKRLDTVGFKSFAERVTVDFVPGVTSVVGPNGSGKSNITDAIRWVLGEQSAKSLRGSKMQDIIFAGSDSRNALNMAEVTLTLDNEDNALPLDYQEVSVTRRVYRSGESEFYINKQACRLKDIVDLFMDSGLGREAFSIISQGKVEEILSSKAEERRSIFEEAAGVLKYKQRKKKAEYKLAETQENLNRVEDIIYEIEGQLEPLKEQAAIAQDYLEKKDELKQVEISLLITQIESLNEQWQQLLADLDSMKREEIQLKTAIQKKEAIVVEERSHIADLDESIEGLQETMLVLTKNLENLEGKKELMKERHKHVEENKSKLESDYEQLTEKLAEIKKLYAEHQSLTQEWKQKRKRTKAEHEEVEGLLSHGEQDIEDEIEELKSDYIEYLNEQAAKRNERQSLVKQLDQLGSKSDAQQDKFKDIRGERQQLIEKRDVATKETNELQKERAEKEEQHKQLDVRLRKEKYEHQDLQTKLYQGYQHLEKMKSKKEMLEEMKEDFSGFFHGVKAVLRAREINRLHNIEGAVLEMIDIPKETITAIETALGAQAQHVIVTDEKAARNAIQWLKESNNGRATFLPLATIQPRFIPAEAKAKVAQAEGFVGVASELVGYDGRVKKAIEHLLGHIIVAEDLKAANDIARLTGRRFRVVTMDGDVVNPGGSMSGGAKKQTNQSLFTREKDLQELTEKLASFQKKTTDVETKVAALKASIQQLEAQTEKSRDELETLREAEQEKRTKLREWEVKLENLNDHLHLFDQDQEQYELESQRMKSRLSELEKELETLDGTLQSTQVRIDEWTEKLNKQQKNEDTLKEKRHQLQISLAEQQSSIRNQQDKLDQLEQSRLELDQEIANNREQYEQLLDVVNMKQTEEELTHDIDDKKSRKQKTMKLIQERREERSKRSLVVEDHEKELKEGHRKHQNYVHDIQDKEVKANRMDVELENLLDYLQKEYFMSFEKAKAEYPPTEELEEAKTKVKLIKRAIDELGTVNLGAIEEYDRIQERYQFLKDQQDDLNEAKDTLYTVISEMDGEMERRFDDTFSQIREKFVVVFQELFGGGRADLRLTNPDDLLETGVDIVAQPPGKKLQNLGLLSGGERALTAIALLFAILQVRPVPFCVLDEVEAALDEANVDRFAKYLKIFSEKTQFIVITHRKGTMEQSDVLYGVTMQESGVSKLVSVRMEETKELVEA